MKAGILHASFKIGEDTDKLFAVNSLKRESKLPTPAIKPNHRKTAIIEITAGWQQFSVKKEPKEIIENKAAQFLDSILLIARVLYCEKRAVDGEKAAHDCVIAFLKDGKFLSNRTVRQITGDLLREEDLVAA